MKRKFVNLLSLKCLLGIALLAVLMTGFMSKADASHFRFAHTTWKKVSGPNVPANTVEITTRQAWRHGVGSACIYIDGPGDRRCGGIKVSEPVDLAGLSYDIWEYTFQHTFTTGGMHTLAVDSCCRIGGLSNSGSNFKVYTDVDLSQNGSSKSAIIPILQWPKGPNSIVLPAVDPDGGPITFRIANSSESGVSLPNTGSGTLSVSSSGVLSWDASTATNFAKYAAQVILTQGGSDTAIDFIIEINEGIFGNDPPACVLNGDTNNTVAVGTPFSISVTGTDPGDNLTVSHLGLPSGATLTPASGTSLTAPVTATFNWTPTSPGAEAVTIIFTDSGNQACQSSFSIDVPACSEAQAVPQSLTILGGNGVQGDIDSYTEASQDGGATWGPAYLTGFHPWGFIDGTNSWINFDPSPFEGEFQTNDFRIRFDVPAVFYNPMMQFEIKVDNYGKVSLNGDQIIPANPLVAEFEASYADIAAVTANLIPGENEITIRLRDAGSWIGLNYKIVITGQSCDPLTLEPSPHFIDADGDGVGDTVDCDDNNPLIYPGAPDTLCNGVDEDCDGFDDKDDDNDGVTLCDGDCDDSNPLIYPGAPDTLCNGIDENCDGYDDKDDDNDGVTVCDGDCDDDNAAIFPGNPEVCDGFDNDCNGLVDDNDAFINVVTVNPTVYLDISGNAMITTGDVDGGSTGCGPVSLSISQSSFSCGNLGNNTITLTVTDGHDNSGSASAIVTVEDNIAPVPDLAELPTATGECSATISTTPTATDNCAGSVTGTTTDPLTYTEQGTYTVSWTYDDGNGNSVTQSQTVVVDDITPPVLHDKPSDETVQCSDDIPAKADVTATDNCTVDLAYVQSERVGDDCNYSFTRTWTATDAGGNVVTHVQSITVADTTAPEVTVSLVPVKVKKKHGCFRVEFTTSDNCDANPAVTAMLKTGTCEEAVTNNQLVKLKLKKKRCRIKHDDGSSGHSGHKHGSNDDDSSSADCGTVKFEGPDFTLTVIAEDACGNETTVTDTPVFPSKHDGHSHDGDSKSKDDDSSGKKNGSDDESRGRKESGRRGK